MISVAKLREESHSGPDLYLSFDEEPINLGALVYLLNEINNAIAGAQAAIQQLTENDDSSLHLMARLALDYAMQCHNELIPDASIDGARFWHDHDSDTGKRITFINPAERIKAANRRKAFIKAALNEAKRE
ncbi:hypothetical protein C4J81_17265 [Deltaproteobacteria bacterium Smac51]|nr:hypothetical protein C4J81_17265 [Deltaproteobacteria bacterium Smac51]